MNTSKKITLLSYLVITASAICINTAAAADSSYELTTDANAQQAIQENRPTYEAYFANSLAAINRADIATSEREYLLAVQSLSDSPDRDNIIRDFDYERAILLIHKEEYERAAAILAPYVFTDKATRRMQSDYLEALFKLGRYKKVVNDAQQLWSSDYTDVSNRAVMFVADSLFKLHDYNQAATKYQLLLTRDSSNLYANLSLAYCFAMLKQDAQALELYEKIYTINPNAEAILLKEAEALLDHDKRQLADKLYKFISEKSSNPNKVKLAQAKALNRNGYSIASNHKLASVATDSTLQREYLAQLFTNSLDNELYYTAMQTMPKLQGTVEYNNYAKLYQHARKGGLSIAFSSMSNYKGNSIQSYRLENDNYLGMNTYMTAAIDNSRFSDTVHTTSVTTSTLGLVHRFERGKLHAAISNAVNGSAHTMYSAGFNYKLTDFTSFGFDLGRRYIGDSKAIINDFISENYYTFSLAHRFNPKNAIFADYTTSSLTDSNHAYGYSLSYSYYPVKERAKSHELYTYYRRSGFSKLSPYYESPDKRIAYGLGWQAQWTMHNGSYWLTRLNLEFGHDNLEPTDFSPAVRVQYTYPIAKHQDISFAVEYGLRTNKLNNINYFMHGYKQLDIKYNISW